MENYNPKIDYLLCKFTYASYIGAVDEGEWKDVYNGIIEPKTKGQHFMTKVKKTLNYIKVHLREALDETISNIYRIIMEKETIELSLTTLIEAIDSYKDFVPARTYYYIIANHVFTFFNKEMAILVHTLLRFKEDKLPIIFYPCDAKSINEKIENGIKIQTIIDYIARISYRTMHLNVPHRLISKEEIITKLLKMKEELRERFGIIALGIYGSYARNEETVYSDLDIYGEVTSDRFGDEDNKHHIFKFLTKELGLNVDGKIRDNNFQYDDLRINMRRELIQLF